MENLFEFDVLFVLFSDLWCWILCWLLDGGLFVVGFGVKFGVWVLDFASTSKLRYWIYGLIIADFECELVGWYVIGNELVFIEIFLKIFFVVVYLYYYGELIVGGESALCLFGYGYVALGRDEDE